MSYNYAINLIWDDDDNGYIALVPEFPHLSAFGKTQQQALEEAQTALSIMIESLQTDGIELPEPHKLSRHSGQLRIRIPTSLHSRLARDAEIDGVSLNSHILSILAGGTGQRKVINEIKNQIAVFGKIYCMGISPIAGQGRDTHIRKYGYSFYSPIFNSPIFNSPIFNEQKQGHSSVQAFKVAS
jgi:predicted RNase H-like HicB family nuclease